MRLLNLIMMKDLDLDNFIKINELESKFTKEFLDDFLINDSEFNVIFRQLLNGMSPYQAIEYLCESKRNLLKEMERIIENQPSRIIVTTDQLENFKNK